MKKILATLLILGLTFGLTLAQDDHSHETGGESGGMGHDEMSHGDTGGEMDHGDMDHSEHSTEETAGEALNVVLAGDSSLTLEPLISADGTLTLGVKVEPPAELSLSVTGPSGEEMGLEATPVMMDAMERGTGGHGEEEHGEEGRSESGGHDMDSMNPDARDVLAFQVGAVEAGVWRFSGTLGNTEVSFPMSIYQASADETDVYLALAPSPALSTRGLSEAFVYAFQEGEAVHSGMMVGREMSGMQHSTDDEQLDLTHNHFNDIYNDAAGFSPMANQAPLSFAMAGTWDVAVTLMGETEETVTFEVDVLDE